MATSSIPYPFPPPCRPFHAQDASIEPMEDEDKQGCDTFINHEACPVFYESEEENYVYMDDDDDGEHDEGEWQKILRSFRENIDEQGHIIYKKLHFKLRRDGTIDRKFRQTWHDFKGRVASEKSSRADPETSNDHMNADRGIDMDDILPSNQGGIEEPKLERFKVKAVNIVGVGVVKEEPRKPK